MPNETTASERDASTGVGETPSQAVTTPPPVGDDLVASLRAENIERRKAEKAYKSRLADLERQLESRTTAEKAAEAARLQAQGEWEKLAKQREADLMAAQSTHQQLRARIREQALTDSLRSGLAKLGVVGPRADFVVKAIRADIRPEFDEEDRPVGDFAEALSAAVSVLGEPAKPAPVVQLAGFKTPSDAPTSGHGPVTLAQIKRQAASLVARGK